MTSVIKIIGKPLGFVQHDFHEGKIALLEFKSISPSVIDGCLEVLQVIVEDCLKEGRLFAVAHDIRQVNITRYALQKAYYFSSSVPRQVQGRMAIILSAGIRGHLMVGMLQPATSPLKGHIETRFFSDHNEALAWLAEQFPPLEMALFTLY